MLGWGACPWARHAYEAVSCQPVVAPIGGGAPTSDGAAVLPPPFSLCPLRLSLSMCLYVDACSRGLSRVGLSVWVVPGWCRGACARAHISDQSLTDSPCSTLVSPLSTLSTLVSRPTLCTVP